MKKRLSTSLKILFALLILVSTLAPAATPAKAATCTQYHTVRRGETLYKIGLQYGVTWRYLADLNDLRNANKIYAGQRLCVSIDNEDDDDQPALGRAPTFRIVKVVTDSTVTIETANFPANDTFVVRMDEFGNGAVNGIRVATLNTGRGGSFSATFEIPESLAGLRRIAIRLESPYSGFYSFNWFDNRTSGSGIGRPYDDEDGYTGIPTFTITSVAKDQSVTIRTNNFPANVRFNVLMGHLGNHATNGTRVATIDSGGGGSFLATFNIPAGLQGDGRIAIRLESPSTGYYSYNWFYNTTTR